MCVQLIRSDYEEPNYDKAKIAPFVLEDPLTFENGNRVNTKVDWKRRREEILHVFAQEMYGEEPPAPDVLLLDKIEEKEDAIGGFGVRSQYKMYFKSDKSGPCVNWLLIRPRYAKKPVPVILFLNYYGNHELTYDKEINLMTSWIYEPDNGWRTKEEYRGRMCNPNNRTVLPIGMVLACGYAVLTACYADISPDPEPVSETDEYNQSHFAYRGGALWGERDEDRTDNTTSLGAWAWGLSRGVDLVESIPELDSARVAVTGSSRLGKTCLLAAARDGRISICIPNQCGGGGVTLAKQDYGENVAIETRYSKHWYCKAYSKYRTNPAKLLTFDQHLLVSTIAPRPLLVEGFDAPWFDMEGEFMACRAASCVWEFLGRKVCPRLLFLNALRRPQLGMTLVMHGVPEPMELRRGTGC